MLRDRHEPMDLLTLVSALRLTLDSVLTQLDRLLDDDTLFQAVKADLSRRLPRTQIAGRPSTPVEVILRMLVVKHLYGWRDKATERWLGDSLVLRQFCRVYAEPVPDETTLLRGANLIQPATLHRLLEHVVVLARSLKVTRGRKLRLDGTVVATNIHHPTDSTWLYEGVRVLSRLVGHAKQAMPEGAVLARGAFRERTRSAKRQRKRILEAARQRGALVKERLRAACPRLLTITTTMVQQAARVGSVLIDQGTPRGRQLATTLHRAVPLVQQVMAQTTRRLFQGKAVPAPDKGVSLCEPHTVIIRKGKQGRPTACGRVLWWAAVEGGSISRYAVLEGYPAEDAQLPPSLDQHRRVCQHPPCRLAGDRGLHTTANDRDATTHGVKRVVVPKPGAKSAKRLAHEPQRWFRRGDHWRLGIEGRISGLKRRHKLDRCRYHGPDGTKRWVGWGVITHHLWVIAHTTMHEPAGEAIEPCQGLIHCQMLGVHAVS